MNKNVIEPMTAEGMGTEKQDGDIIIEKAYTFRKLNSTDTFLMFKVIGKIGIDKLSKSFNGDFMKSINQTKDYKTIGISVALEVTNVILGNLPKCETEIYELLSSTSNLTVEEIKGLDFATFTEMVIDFIKKEEFKDFIKVVSKSFN